MTDEQVQKRSQEDIEEQNRKTVRNNRIVRVLLVVAIAVIVALLVTRCGKETDYLIQVGSDMVPYIAR